jgi:hypothetical protein
MKHLIHCTGLVAALGLLASANTASAADHFFSHFTGTAGAVGRFSVAVDPPALSPSKQVAADKEAFRLTRLRMGPGGKLFGMNEDNAAPWVLSIDPSKKPAVVNRITLEDRPMEIRVAGNHILTAGHRGMLHLIDPVSDKIVATWTPLRGMGRITDFAVMPDGSTAIAIARRDSATGNVRGHRVLVFDLPSLKLRHDLELPRNQPTLHYKDGGKDSGPGPLFVLLSPATNTLVLGLNTYGAVHLADLDAALKGEWKNTSVTPTSADGAWGTSFPSAGMVFPAAGREFAIISNGSAAGGSVLVDLAARKITQHLATGPRSLWPPIHQPGSKRIVAISSGLEYSRGPIEIDDKHVEPTHFFTIDVAPLETGGEAVVSRIEMGEYTYEGTPADPANENLWVIAVRNPESGKLALVLYDVAASKELGRQPSPGVVRNFVPAPVAAAKP